MISIKLKGAEKLLARINKAKTEKSLWRIATREGAKVVADRVKSDLPVRTGATVKGVKVRATKKKLGASVIVGLPGQETYRGWFLEVGTKDRYTKAGAFRGAMMAKHYVAHALESMKDQVLSVIKSVVGSKVWQ